MRRLLMLLVLSTGALAGGCTTYPTTGYATVTATTTYGRPPLAYVSPGVYVVEDYHQPVFYSNNVYWRYYNGGWYRSRYYDRGWTYYARPPSVISSINRPYAYVRYRPSYRYRGDYDRDRYDRGRYDRGRYDRGRYDRGRYNRD